MELNRQEIEVLITALAHYEKNGLDERISQMVVGKAMKFIGEGGSNISGVANEITIEMEQKREQVVLLRAKLIHMKDKVIANELAD